MIADPSRGEWLDTLSLVDAEEACDPINSLHVLKRKFASSAKVVLMRSKTWRRFSASGAASTERLRGGFCIDEQDIELLAQP
jgi:hypothetical protein